MTPKPQANTLDEKTRKDLVGIVQNTPGEFNVYTILAEEIVKRITPTIQALITEARVDEVKRIDPTSDYVLNDLVMSVGDRLTQLKEKL